MNMMFNKVLIDLILQGKKTMTSRDKLYEVGEVTNLMAIYHTESQILHGQLGCMK
jgi:uncharacterized protein YqfB (UPF0267 family)